ncbi:MAG: P-loop NTPase [Desulfobacterales bacterium]|nr:P-loop NTPase [Desulfobacterales bacterium]
MKELVIISGKGGTGKTSLVSAFAGLAPDKVLCDADVDAADLHLIMNPDTRERRDFRSGHTAVINREKCSECGLCLDLCRWNAINDTFKVDPLACEGCGVCVYFCPEKAVEFPENKCGEWFVSDTRFGPMVHARLGIAEENSGKLVSLVRRKARELATEKGLDLIITDGPPGTGCPVIASIGGADAVLIVTEPTVSGKHDMERVVDLAAHFKVPVMVCVNKSDLNPEAASEIEKFSEQKHLIFSGQIPFDPVFTKSMVQGQTILEYNTNSKTGQAVKNIWKKCQRNLDNLTVTIEA